MQEGFAVDMGYNPVVAQREGRPPISRRASASRPRRRSCWSTRTSSSSPSASAELKDFWDKEFKARLRLGPNVAMTASATADSLGSLAAREKRGGRLSTAAMLIGPATIFVTVGLLIPIVILFRYSLNQFVPGKLMVEALTLENYVLFFTDPYYTAAFYRTLRVAVIVTALCLRAGASRSPTSWRARRAGSRTS